MADVTSDSRQPAKPNSKPTTDLSTDNQHQVIHGLHWYYIFGAAVWIIYFFELLLFGVFTLVEIWAPTMIISVIFVANYTIVRSGYHLGDFQGELSVYSYVEKNAAHMLVASTFFLMLVSPKTAGLMEVETANKIILVQAVSAGLACLVLALVAVPTSRPLWVCHIRHIKTVFLTWSIGTFLIGPVVLLQHLRLS